MSHKKFTLHLQNSMVLIAFYSIYISNYPLQIYSMDVNLFQFLNYLYELSSNASIRQIIFISHDCLKLKEKEKKHTFPRKKKKKTLHKVKLVWPKKINK